MAIADTHNTQHNNTEHQRKATHTRMNIFGEIIYSTNLMIRLDDSTLTMQSNCGVHLSGEYFSDEF